MKYIHIKHGNKIIKVKGIVTRNDENDLYK
ncbi:Protein of unknown function [Bacillus cytotoxicus]|uniref:Uncharacterized protein n=1 Tax=Bacillus cytotoxicus TaxID=580165 RepID=A0AAX2CHH6_9BACI|nr:Protein of unknown function [Bacillus cytotoxicus]SCN37550.1 Protein of unknown function [Bacillus cytotoxicus]